MYILFVLVLSFETISADDVSRRLVAVGALRVNKCDFSVYNIINCLKPNFPSKADEIADRSRPEMNIKVAAKSQ